MPSESKFSISNDTKKKILEKKFPFSLSLSLSLSVHSLFFPSLSLFHKEKKKQMASCSENIYSTPTNKRTRPASTDAPSRRRRNYFDCAFCHKTFDGYGNNPWPVADSGRCCDMCNLEIVVKKRVSIAEKFKQEIPSTPARRYESDPALLSLPTDDIALEFAALFQAHSVPVDEHPRESSTVCDACIACVSTVSERSSCSSHKSDDAGENQMPAPKDNKDAYDYTSSDDEDATSMDIALTLPLPVQSPIIVSVSGKRR